MERFKERACVDRNWLKRGSYSVCVKRAETQGEYTRLACADSRLYLAHRAYPPGHGSLPSPLSHLSPTSPICRFRLDVGSGP